MRRAPVCTAMSSQTARRSGKRPTHHSHRPSPMAGKATWRCHVPKRRISTARQRAASAKNLIRARAAKDRAAVGSSHPTGKAGRVWPRAIRGSFGTVRRHKLGGKAYQKKTGSGFKPSAEANAILAGTQGFRNPRVSAMESRAAMGTGPKVPLAEWYAKPKPVAGPSTRHGSGTGLTSAYRYLKPFKKGR